MAMVTLQRMRNCHYTLLMLEKLLSLLLAYRPDAVDSDREEGVVAPVSFREGGRPEDHFLITFNT